MNANQENRAAPPAACSIVTPVTKESTMLLTMLVLAFLIALLGGGFGYRRYGYASISPLGVVIVVAIVLFLLGYLR
jgi:hypothetical protein